MKFKAQKFIDSNDNKFYRVYYRRWFTPWMLYTEICGYAFRYYECDTKEDALEVIRKLEIENTPYKCWKVKE